MRLSLPHALLEVAPFGDLRPDRILAGSPGTPVLFTTTDVQGRLLLAYRCAADATGTDYFVVPTDAARVESLLANDLALHEALDLPWTWLVACAADGSVQRVQAVRAAEMPGGVLPPPDAGLAPELRLPTEDSEALLMDGFGAALLGLGTCFTHEVAIYDYERCVAVLVAQGLPREDAVEYLEFNAAGAYVGEHTPVLLRYRAHQLDLDHP